MRGRVPALPPRAVQSLTPSAHGLAAPGAAPRHTTLEGAHHSRRRLLPAAGWLWGSAQQSQTTFQQRVRGKNSRAEMHRIKRQTVSREGKGNGLVPACRGFAS